MSNEAKLIAVAIVAVWSLLAGMLFLNCGTERRLCLTGYKEAECLLALEQVDHQ